MKKFCFCLTIFAALLFFAGCGGKKENKDETPDPEETVTDEDAVDAEQTDESEPEDDPDMEPAEVDPCDPNPCTKIANSDGECTASETQYTCGCENGYTWNGLACVRSNPLPLAKICTGQNLCYDLSSSLISCPSSPEADFYGQDKQYAALGYCTPQSFTATSDVVVDNNTGLIWEKSPSSTTYIWEEAHSHCDDLNEEAFAGIDTWRVPNPSEFLTIADNSKSEPAINSVFPAMSANLWTSKSYNDESGDSAYYFSTSYGTEAEFSKTKKLKVLCVSGEEMLAAKESDFEVSEDGSTVTDKRTGLVWESITHSHMDWKAILAYCHSLNNETETGWRLPNKNEIASLLDPDAKRPWSNFPTFYSGDHCLWSSSTYVDVPKEAWEICFGHVGRYQKDFENNAFICVK